ncbi:isoprenylcysteine carboxylmethyltransferase family protein [Deltaproteobacteria bacterium TL4]
MKWFFTGLVGILIIQRLFELRLSQRNEARILLEGGREYSAEHYPVMVLLHTSWFIAMLLEVWLLRPQFYGSLFIGALAFTLLGQVLRYAAIRTLGWRWSTRIMVLPDVPPIHAGIYRYIRHPNYLGVILEIAAVPLLHSAYWTAICFSIANAFLLKKRILAEELALNENQEYHRHS